MKIIIMLLSALIYLSACQPAEKEREPNRKPKTSFGKAYHKAKDLSDQTDDRASQMDRQADEIFTE